MVPSPNIPLIKGGSILEAIHSVFLIMQESIYPRDELMEHTHKH